MSATENVKEEVRGFLSQLDSALAQIQQRLAFQRSASDFSEHTTEWVDERVRAVRSRRELLEQQFRDFEGHADHSWRSFRDQIAASFEQLQDSLAEAGQLLGKPTENEDNGQHDSGH